MNVNFLKSKFIKKCFVKLHPGSNVIILFTTVIYKLV
jgi:hypothetical protein